MIITSLCSPPAHTNGAYAELGLVFGVGNNGEIILAQVETAGARSLSEHADYRVGLVADPHLFADGIDV